MYTGCHQVDLILLIINKEGGRCKKIRNRRSNSRVTTASVWTAAAVGNVIGVEVTEKTMMVHGVEFAMALVNV